MLKSGRHCIREKNTSHIDLFCECIIINYTIKSTQSLNTCILLKAKIKRQENTRDSSQTSPYLMASRWEAHSVQYRLSPPLSSMPSQCPRPTSPIFHSSSFHTGCIGKLPRGFVKMQILVQKIWNLRPSSANKFPGDVNTSRLGTTLQVISLLSIPHC